MLTELCFVSSNIASDDQLYTDHDIEKSMERIETVNFHQVLCIFITVTFVVVVGQPTI